MPVHLPDLRWLVVTAANEPQTEGYRIQLDARRRRGLLPEGWQTTVVPDPEGKRIGSGGATLNVLRHLRERGVDPPSASCLVLHSGGDSRRIPHQMAFGKLFATIPRQTPDGGLSSVFDEMLVPLVPLVEAAGPGVTVASGDVILQFDPHAVQCRGKGVTSVAFPVPPDEATGHGVYLLNGDGGEVHGFLQKPSVTEMQRRGALRPDGQVAVDTGILHFCREYTGRLTELAEAEGLWRELGEGGCQLDLYRDFVWCLLNGAGPEGFAVSEDGPCAALKRALEGAPFHGYAVSPSRFIHLGTTAQYRREVTEPSALAPEARCPAATSVVGDCCLSGTARASWVAAEGHAAAGPGTLVENCRFGGEANLEGRCLVSCVATGTDTLAVPAHTVLWQAPVAGDSGEHWVSVTYGIDDDPRAPLTNGATFLGSTLRQWLADHHATAEDLWPDEPPESQCLWTARLYPVSRERTDLSPVRWIWGIGNTDQAARWRVTERLSLAELSLRIDRNVLHEWLQDLEIDCRWSRPKQWVEREVDVVAAVAAASPRQRARLLDSLERCGEAEHDPLVKARIWAVAAGLVPDVEDAEGSPGKASPARRYLVRALEEVKQAVESGVEDTGFELSEWALAAGEQVRVCCPARVDFAGGWTDTPPYSLERGGVVLNAALLLDGELPVSATVKRLPTPELVFESRETGRPVCVGSLEELRDHGEPTKPCALHKASVATLLDLASEATDSLEARLEALGGGIEVTTSSRAPTGSGLGTSSILAAAVIRALSAAFGRTLSNDALFAQVLRIEQMMGTGGGWQDQVGGVVPGIKLVESEAGCRQQLRVTSLDLPSALLQELEERMVVYFTGQRRVAKYILHSVVGRYLSRECAAMDALARIRALATEGAEALCAGDLDHFAQVLTRSWQANKRLDPGSSNAELDQLFEDVGSYIVGGKLAGAGGGGFAFLLAKDAQRASDLKTLLAKRASGTEAYVANWRLDTAGMATDTAAGIET